MNDPRAVTLSNFQAGALEELFGVAMSEVLENIDNPNTDWKPKREISLKLVFEPNEKRNQVIVTPRLTTKLAGVAQSGTTLFLGRHEGQASAREAPNQADMFQTPAGRPKPVDPPAAAAAPLTSSERTAAS